MKNSPPSSQKKSKQSPAKKVIGGQPESDQEAREAGLKSATSGERKKPNRQSAEENSEHERGSQR